MTLLDKHIGIHVVWGTTLALLVLLSVFTFTEFVEDLDSVGRGTYSLLRAGEYMVLTLPRRAFELFPISALIGSLLGLGGLASNSELIVVRAAGVSLARITLSVMKAGALLMLVAIVVGEVLAPLCERLAQERRSVALSNQIALKTGEPLQSHVQNGLRLFFGQTKFLQQLGFGFRRRFGCTNQSHDSIQIIQCNL